VRSAGTISLPFAALTQTLTFDSVRVIKPSGQVIETPAGDAQDVPLPVTQQAPMYSDLRTRQLPVRSLGTGDTLEYRITIKDSHADEQGALWYATDFTDGIPVMQETLEVHLPREIFATVHSKTVQPTVTESSGERIYSWTHETASQYPKANEPDKSAQVELVPETYNPDVAITSFHTWAEFGAWYRSLIAGRATPDAAIRAKAEELTRGLTTDEARMTALYNYVATQYRYIAVSFGIGRLQPHTAPDILANQYGDCKDKSTLLEALLAAVHIDAEPVLISSSGAVNEALPMPPQFDHMITLVKLKNRDVWLDSTPEVAPAGFLLAGLRNKLALAIPASGDARLVQTEAAPPFPVFMNEFITAQLGMDDVLKAHFDLTLRGDLEVVYRILYHTVPRAKWQQLQQQISYQSGFAGDVTNVDADIPEKTDKPFHVSWDYVRKDFGEWQYRRIPMLVLGLISEIPADATAPKRPMRLDAGMKMAVHTVLTLPEGYTLTAPTDVSRIADFAEYRATYALKGNVLTSDHTVQMKVNELPVSQFDAYRNFLKAGGDDISQMLQLVGAGAAQKASANVKPDNPQAAELMQEAYQSFRNGNHAAARESLDQVKALNDQQRGLWAEYGALDWFTDPDKAVTEYRREIELHPDSLFAYKNLSLLLISQRKWADAERALNAWSHADPADSAPFANLGQLQIAQKRYKDAEDSFTKAIARSDKPEQLRISLAQAQLKSGNTVAGETTLKALISSSEDPFVVNNAAYELADAGLDLPACEAASVKQVTALEHKTSAVTLATVRNEDFNSTSLLAASWDTLGWIYFKEGRAASAEPYLKAAWLLLPNAETALHLGMTEEAQGRLGDALRTYGIAQEDAQHPNMLDRERGLRSQIDDRMDSLEQRGVRATAFPGTQQGGDQLGALRTYAFPSPLHGQYASADFLLLLGENRAEDVQFLKGNEALRPATAALERIAYRSPLPPGSKAKLLRRGIVACTTGSKTCLLVLLPTAQASLN